MRVFLASPYRGSTPQQRQQNIEMARALLRMVVLCGHAPFSPHLLYPGALNEDVPEERDAGIRAGAQFLLSCKELWFFWGPQGITAGMRKELELARLIGIRTRAVVLSATGTKMLADGVCPDGAPTSWSSSGFYVCDLLDHRNTLWINVSDEDSRDPKWASWGSRV